MLVKGSAAKRHKQSEKRRMHNRIIRSRVRTGAKRVLTAVDGGDATEARRAFGEFVKLVDSAGRKGVYHRNAVARKKSRMAKKVNALGA